MLTNPVTAAAAARSGFDSIVEYVNDWRDAIKVMLPAASETGAPTATLASSGAAAGGAEKV